MVLGTVGKGETLEKNTELILTRNECIAVNIRIVARHDQCFSEHKERALQPT